ncbi:DNA topoisomerase VI subunit B [Candidatus Micrarchaeota archaeon]|nr:DNA topoisomerase VI subunit B [Candidatus Micrarchaeota archaeon]MBU1166227.1 DNA topoisomerase VI subunit B [Candidatus Micrarchaeota archaeon]MBU1886200.1 DNA topoisomerase VI subunit B [Candidatus Micrarchaeota archaeon]
MTKESFDEFKEHSVAEFFKKNRQMLGFSGKIRSLTMIVHEFVTNSLDACEEAGILPEISVKIEELGNEHYQVSIKDNGTGIPKTHLGKALGQMLAGTKFHRYIQQRGQQGIGAAACTMFSYITTGQATNAITCHNGTRIAATISMDFKNNKPIIDVTSTEPTLESGLTVISEYKEVKYEKGNHGVYEYLRRTALANPHCLIELIEPSNERTVFPRSVEKNPPKAFEIQPHPLGIGTHDLIELAKHDKEHKRLSAFLQNRFSRVSAAKIEELRSLAPDVDFNMKPGALTWESAEKVVKTFSEVKWISPATDSLVPIGKEQIEASFTNIFNPEILVVTQRPPRIYRGGIPFLVEVGIAYGGGIAAAKKKGEIMRFANKVPLLFDTGGCAITETIKTMDWKRYNIKEFEEEPIAVLVNLISVHIPYTSAGKQAISQEEEVMSEIKFALMEASRGVQKYLSGKRKAHEIATKRKVVSRYVQQLSADLALLTGGKQKKIEQELEMIIDKKYATSPVAEETNENDDASNQNENNDADGQKKNNDTNDQDENSGQENGDGMSKHKDEGDENE